MEPLLPHLNHLRPVDSPQSPMPSSPGQGGGVKGPSFSEYMKEQIEKVNASQAEAETAMNMWATGETDNVGEVMTAVKKAEVAFDMLLEVRSKVQEAYAEIMRMQV